MTSFRDSENSSSRTGSGGTRRSKSIGYFDAFEFELRHGVWVFSTIGVVFGTLVIDGVGEGGWFVGVRHG